MGSLQQQKQVELKKRILFFGAGALGVVMTATGSPIIGISLLALGTYLGWGWFKYRAKNGMRF